MKKEKRILTQSPYTPCQEPFRAPKRNTPVLIGGLLACWGCIVLFVGVLIFYGVGAFKRVKYLTVTADPTMPVTPAAVTHAVKAKLVKPAHPEPPDPHKW